MNKVSLRFSETLMALLPIPIIVAWAFANFIFTNRFDNYLYSELAQYYLFMTLAFVLPAALAMLFFPTRRHTIAIISYLGTAALFLLPGIIDIIGPAVRQRYIIGPVLLAAILAGLWLQKKLAGRKYVRGFVIAFLFLAAIPLGQLAIHQLTISDRQSRAEVPLQGDAVRRPNVYFILLDAYARGDQLKSVFGYDNGPFLTGLREMGLYIADESFASYPETAYSISTTFRMAFMLEMEPNIYKTRFDSPVFRNFRRLGYRIQHIPPLQNLIRCPDGIECFFTKSKVKMEALGYLGMNLLQMLPVLPTFIARFFPSLRTFNSNELKVFLDFMKEGPPKPPTFLYAHFEMPHPPYLRDANCDPVPLNLQVDRAHLGWGEKSKYLGFLRCGNKTALKVVRRIVEMDPEAIIIVQSDHGSYFRQRSVPGKRAISPRKGERWYLDALEETFGTLNAWRLPAPCRKWLTPDLSNINTFRLVFGCLTGSPPQLLPNRSYWVDHANDRLLLLREDGRWTVPAAE